MHWLIHLAGIDTQRSWAYDFWSGIGTQATLLLTAAGAYHKHNCHRRRCPRIGKHVHDGTPYCRHHRPDAEA